MAELALVINIIETVKLTYRVAHYVHETIQSAKNEDTEQQQISSDYKIELLFFGSFRRFFEKAQGVIAYDQALDEVSHCCDPALVPFCKHACSRSPNNQSYSYGSCKSSRSLAT